MNSIWCGEEDRFSHEIEGIYCLQGLQLGKYELTRVVAYVS
jgi:hypothetical protein